MSKAIVKRVTNSFQKENSSFASAYGGESVSPGMSVTEALVECGLNWSVKLCPILLDIEDNSDDGLIENKITLSDKNRTPFPGVIALSTKKDGITTPIKIKGTGQKVPVNGYYANYREDTNASLGIVKGRYTPLKNSDAFGWLDRIIGRDGIFLECGGSLHGGRLTFIVADFGSFETVEGDVVRKHVLISNAHDGTGSLTFHPIPARVLNHTLFTIDKTTGSGSSEFKIKHKDGVISDEEIQRVLNLCYRTFNWSEEMFRLFGTTELSVDEQRDIVYSVLNVYWKDVEKYTNDEFTKQPQWVSEYELIDAISQRTGEGFGSGTIWTIFNAIAYYHDRVRIVRGSGDRPDNRAESRVFGYSADQKRRTWNVCLNLSEKKNIIE